MVAQYARYLALVIIFHISTLAAALPLNPSYSAAPIVPSLSLIRPLLDDINATEKSLPSGLNFPPGPPPSPLFYDIPGSDLTLELSPLGLVRGRDEGAVEMVLNEALRASVDPYRPQKAISEDGYQKQERGFLLGVTPSARLPGEERLRWGMWTTVLISVHGYVEAYPGYDFSFEIWLTPQIGQSKGYVIGLGFAFTRS